MVSWNEYHSYFLQKNGYNDSSYGLEYTDNGVEKIIHRKKMPRRLEEAIMRDKASWSETSKMDPNHLTLDEFLSFRHPESSYSTIVSLVDEIYKKFGTCDPSQNDKNSINQSIVHSFQIEMVMKY